jgi:hypothetical protein
MAPGTVTDQRKLWMKTFGAAPYRKLVITWERFPRDAVPNSEYTFQVVFYETTNAIRFQYLDGQGDKFDEAIGIEDEFGTRGLQVSRNANFDISSNAIEFRPLLPGPAMKLRRHDRP